MDSGTFNYRRFRDGGDEDGLVEIIKEYKDGLIFYLNSIVGNIHTAEELTEDTFVSVAVLKAPIQWDEQHEVQAIFLVSVSRQKNKKLQDFYATTARLLLDEQRIGQLIQKRSYQTLAECLEAVDNERTE